MRQPAWSTQFTLFPSGEASGNVLRAAPMLREAVTGEQVLAEAMDLIYAGRRPDGAIGS